MATTTTSIATASVSNGGFYAPQFRLFVPGSQLPKGVIADITEVTYHDKIDEIDSCEISVNNWDASKRRFKYLGADQFDKDGAPNKSDPDWPNWVVFDPCSRNVSLQLGYASSGLLPTMMVGNFTTLEPNFPSSGPPVLSVRMLNRLHKLRSKQYNGEWADKTECFIAKDIAKKRDSQGKPRLPMPLKVDDQTAKNEKPVYYIAQKNQYDIDFLWQRARLNDYVLLIRGEDTKEELYFGPSDAKARPTYQLEWGQSLIDFKPVITTANQYKSVTVRGWDRAAQKKIEEKVDFTDPDIKSLNRNLRPLVENCDPRDEYVEELPVFTRADARQRALAILKSQAKHMVKASGTTVGLPLLRAGSKIQLGKSVGSRLMGTYFVTATTHTINNSGYTTRFDARREDEDSSGAGK